MCARYTLTARPDLVGSLFDLVPPPDLPPRFNVAPTQDVLAVRLTPDGKRAFARLRWGLIPSWAHDPSIGNKLLNARSETVAEKPSFRDAFRKRRCLIPADGFFEWKTEDGTKQPYFIHKPGRAPFAFAGLWESWESEDGTPVETCTIITTEANGLLKPLHDRMPVILGTDDFAKWLDPKTIEVKKLDALFRPLPEDALRLYPVTPKANNARFDDPSCVEPFEPEARARQGSLFD